jgi:hypothetical protein
MAADEAVHMAALADALYHSRRFFLRHYGRPHMLHGSVYARVGSTYSPTSSDANGRRPPKIKHAGEDMNGSGDLGHATPIGP